MQKYDPLVANGIIYAPIRDIVMSNDPVYGIERYRPNGSNFPKEKQDAFVSQNPEKKSSSWWKWAIGIGATIGAVIGLKKGGKKGLSFLRNSVKCQNFFTNHPKIKSVLSSIKNHIPIIKKW